MGHLNGKRALVTAGGQGIGLAITRELIRGGCDVCVHYFSSRVDLEALRAEAPEGRDPRLSEEQADLTREEDAERMVGSAIESLGGLEILINNAGSLLERRWLADLDVELFEDTLDLNLGSMAWVTRAARAALAAAGGASVVNLSSLAGRKGGHPGSLMYATAKGAVLTWTRALSTELAPEGIRVNAVAPGLILGTSFHDTHTSRESAEETIRGIPLGRAGAPEDVARAVAYLASEYDGFITGATIDINGGVYCA